MSFDLENLYVLGSPEVVVFLFANDFSICAKKKDIYVFSDWEIVCDDVNSCESNFDTSS